MSLSLKVAGRRCNAGCEYCYQQVARNELPARETNVKEILETMEKQLETFYSVPYLHGGECLLIGHEKIERILKRIHQEFGRTSIQTNGVFIDDRYIEMFKKYKTSVGVSIDGPPPLNRARKVPERDVDEFTKEVMDKLKRMREMGIQVSVLSVLTTYNGLPEQRDTLKDWIKWLDSIGIVSGRINLAVSNGQCDDIELTPAQAKEVWVDLFEYTVLENVGWRWKPYRDIPNNLLGQAQGTCVFSTCMYYHAHTEAVVLPDGKSANCTKTGMAQSETYPRNPEIRNTMVKDGKYGGIRYNILPQIPQKHGGCKGCKFWHNCLGGCCASAINSDWRNRTKFCQAYYGLFERAETALRGLMPGITLSCDSDIERKRITASSMQEDPFESYKQEIKNRRCNPVRPYDKKTERHDDGNIRHLDSSEKQKTNSGRPRKDIEHVDGDFRHLDSDI